MGGRLDLFNAAKRERLRIINPEVQPDAALGDVGYFVPPLDELDRDMAWWRCRMVRIAAAIVGVFAVALIALVLFACWIGGWRG